MNDVQLRQLIIDRAKGKRVLEVGGGLSSYGLALVKEAKYTAYVDAHQPYLAKRRDEIASQIDCPEVFHRVGWFSMTIQQFVDLYPTPLQFDLVLMIDVLEHIEKEEAQILLPQLWAMAEDGLIFTPRGFHKQDKDYYNMGGERWQTHRSGWDVEDFNEALFDVQVLEGFHRESHPQAPDALLVSWK